MTSFELHRTLIKVTMIFCLNTLYDAPVEGNLPEVKNYLYISSPLANSEVVLCANQLLHIAVCIVPLYQIYSVTVLFIQYIKKKLFWLCHKKLERNLFSPPKRQKLFCLSLCWCLYLGDWALMGFMIQGCGVLPQGSIIVGVFHVPYYI